MVVTRSRILQRSDGSLKGVAPPLVILLLSGLWTGAFSPSIPEGTSPATVGEEAWDGFTRSAPLLVTQDDTTRARKGRLSRRARALLKRTTIRDTTRVTGDTTGGLRGLAALPRDSTARLANFKHVRKDVPYSRATSPTVSPLYVRVPAGVSHVAVLDTSDWRYTVRTLVDGVDVKIPVQLSFDEYRARRLRNAVRRNWESLAHKYVLEGVQKRGLSDIFGEVTNIEIPVPKNPIFSIFGPNIIRIQINGSVDVHGAFRSTKSDVATSNPLDQVRNEPDFNQEVQVNVKGEIGDKLKISADWNTERTFEYENQLRVQYQGYDDEIVKSVEAGNVSLQTRSSFISSSQALFGIKAGFQFGPLALTTIASQKKGQIKELSVSGGGRPEPFEKKAPDFSRDHYFLDTLYRPLYKQALKTIPIDVDPTVQILDIEVWVTRPGVIPDENEREIVAFINADSVRYYQTDDNARLNGQFTGTAGRVEVGTFIKLVPNVDYTYDEYLGYISLNRSLQTDQAIAACYELPSGPVGNFSAQDQDKNLKLIMKLVRPRRLDPSMRQAWDQMLKNIYQLGGRGIKKEGFQLGVEYLPPSGTAEQTIADGRVNIMEMLRLDRFDETGAENPDNTFDYLPGITVDAERGELIFPMLEPFADNIREYFLENPDNSLPTNPSEALALAKQYTIDEVYDTTYNGAVNSPNNRFVIKGNIVSSVASTYNLGFNVVEGSVEVIVDGERKLPNVHYTVDYLTGQVVIKDQSLLVPGKNLQIKYEANDLFQLASKSLLGARGELALGKKSTFGFTIMNLNQETLSDKVRLGEEPVNNTIFGLDGRTSFETEFLTDALNWLPGVKTTAASNITLAGEAAYMSPDPNTRKSVISQDNGLGIAYIDDFEGARRTTPLGIAYGTWKDASPPTFIGGLDPYLPPLDGVINYTDPTVRSQLLPDTSKMEYKGKLSWYNILPSDIDAREIWPEREVRPGEDRVTALNLRYQPRERGRFNYSLDLDSKLRPNPQQGWAGVMRLLSTTTTNLVDENVSFIEFWIKFEKTRPNAKLLIDLGFISEDAVVNRKLDTEDGLGGTIRTGIINNPSVQDVGLDALSDDQERLQYAAFIGRYPEYEGDPSGDNYIPPAFYGSLRPEDYVGYNGTERNYVAEAGRYADTEDLNFNGVLDQIIDYFEYEIPLDTSSLDFTQYMTGGGAATGWYQIRIPINKYVRSIGQPTLTNVEAIRMWMTGADDEVLIRMVEFNLVGNQWEPVIKNDEKFRVSVVNVEDNPYYTSPPGLPRPIDRSRPDQIIQGNEQSLSLTVDSLGDGMIRQAARWFSVRPLDLFNYREMKMFVHGDESRLSYVDTTNYDLAILFRFGGDSLNYYEYRAPIRPGWDPMNDINIRFSDITAIKLGRDSINVVSPPVPVPDGPPGATFRVRGNPTLTTVRYFSVGLENPEGIGIPRGVTADVWVNELRLTDVDDTPGWAYRVETAIQLADISTISFSMSERDPFFHGLEDRFGNRNENRNWTLNANVGFEKFLPTSWAGSSLRFSYSHVEAMLNPRYVPGTDILVDEAADRFASIERENGASEQDAATAANAVRGQSQSLSVTETYSLPNLALRIPAQTWLVTETINRMSFSYSFSRTRRRDPTIETYYQWGWNISGSYGLQFSPANFLSPFASIGDFFLLSPWKSLKLFFTPKTLNFSAGFNRAQTRQKVRNRSTPNPVGRNFVSNRGMGFSWQWWDGGFINPSTDYQLSIVGSLVHLEVDEFGNQRHFSNIVDDMFMGTRFVDFGIPRNYNQNISLGTRLVVPAILKFDKIFSPSARYSVRYDWQNNFQAGALGKSAAWSSNLSLSTDINLKFIGNEIWSPTPSAQRNPADTSGSGPSITIWDRIDSFTRIFFKIPFFDFDRLNVSFSQTNSSRNSGVVGRTGFDNLFGLAFFLPSTPESGPSSLYQLGLVSDPHGKLVIGTSGSFPFFQATTYPGRRAPLGNLTDVFAQSNRVTMRTSRPLWEGARIDINWNLGWTYNLNRAISTDSLGVPTVRSRVVSGTEERSFLTFPPVLIFKFFGTGIEEVNKIYLRAKQDPGDPRSPDEKLSQAFLDGFEAIPIMSKLLKVPFPRPNWTIRWDGLEKIALLGSFAQRVSLDHSYNSNYRSRWKITPTGGEVTESQQVGYGFVPLIGVTIRFKELGKGNFGANFRLSSTTTYDLSPSAQNIVESHTEDVTITANYNRQGFEIPFFGLSLSNDLDVSFSYSISTNSRRLYDMKKDFKKDGEPLEGTIRTVIEPRIRYILSSRVTASIYYRYTRLKPDEGGSRIPGSTINEGGLDVRIAIQ